MTLYDFITWCFDEEVPLSANITIRNCDGDDKDELIPLQDEHLDYIYDNNEIIVN